MLRHIISVSLAMVACATLIPTKVNAATLTVTPGGSIPRNPGSLVEFTFLLDPEPSDLNVLFLETLQFDYDRSELSFSGGTTLPLNTLLTQPEIIARLTFTVIQPVKDGVSDLFNAKVYFRQGGSPGETSPAFAGDVEPVPEPVTIFGTATAIGCGILFKRKSFKKTVS